MKNEKNASYYYLIPYRNIAVKCINFKFTKAVHKSIEQVSTTKNNCYSVHP
jgi:hypothetical protein